MKIIQIDIVNNKKIKCFMAELKGDNLEISGETGTGKTTGISALWEIMEKQSDALAHGEKKGHVKIKIADGDKFIIAKRNITPKTSTITIMDSEGEKVSVSDFKNMISELSVNPHKILAMKQTEQVKTLSSAADIGDFDLVAKNVEILDLEASKLEAFQKCAIMKPEEEPENVEKVELVALIKEKDAAEETNRKNEKSRDALFNLESDKTNCEERILEEKTKLEDIQKMLTALELDYTGIGTRIKNGKAHVKTIKDIETEPILEKIKTCEATNKKATLHEAWVLKGKNHKESIEGHAKIVDDIKKLRDDKKTALDNAKWPIPGLSVADGNIIYNDCLLTNLGTSEQMLVCAALAIEDIKNHPIKVVRMDGVESMSKTDFNALKKLFNGNGIQVLSTRVSRGDVEPEEITIVDGTYGHGKE